MGSCFSRQYDFIFTVLHYDRRVLLSDVYFVSRQMRWLLLNIRFMPTRVSLLFRYFRLCRAVLCLRCNCCCRILCSGDTINFLQPIVTFLLADQTYCALINTCVKRRGFSNRRGLFYISSPVSPWREITIVKYCLAKRGGDLSVSMLLYLASPPGTTFHCNTNSTTSLGSIQ